MLAEKMVPCVSLAANPLRKEIEREGERENERARAESSTLVARDLHVIATSVTARAAPRHDRVLFPTITMWVLAGPFDGDTKDEFPEFSA